MSSCKALNGLTILCRQSLKPVHNYSAYNPSCVIVLATRELTLQSLVKSSCLFPLHLWNSQSLGSCLVSQDFVRKNGKISAMRNQLNSVCPVVVIVRHSKTLPSWSSNNQ